MLAMERKERDHRGFTLTEAAIVLGIMGLILGAIWVAASAVYSSMKVKRAEEQFLQLAQNIRSIYATQSTIAGESDASTAFLAGLIRAGAYPTDNIHVRSSDGALLTKSPWATSDTGFVFRAYPATIDGIAGAGFRIYMTTVPRDACIKLVRRMVGVGDPGLVAIATSSASEVALADATTIADIRDNVCTNATANQVGFIFRLH